MKQLVISPCFPYSTHTFVTREVAETIARGHDVIVLAPGNGDSQGQALAKQLKIDPERVIYADILKSPVFTPNWRRFTQRLRTVSQREVYGLRLAEKRKSYFCRLLDHPLLQGVDLIHAHFTGWAYELALPLSELLGIPFTLTAHDSHLAKQPPYFFDTLQQKASAITLPSRAWRDIWVDKTHSSDRLHVLPNAVDIDNFRLGDGPGSASTELKIITIGRLVPHKRVADGIHAIRRLIDLGFPCHYTIIGAGPEDGRLQQVAQKLDIANHVRFLGKQPNERVIQELKQSDIFLHPSSGESFGIAVIEAMAAGLPVVAARSAGTQDTVTPGITGQLYPPGDINALVRFLTLLIRDPELRNSQGNAGRERTQSLYSWDSHMEVLLAVWHKALVLHNHLHSTKFLNPTPPLPQ